MRAVWICAMSLVAERMAGTCDFVSIRSYLATAAKH